MSTTRTPRSFRLCLTLGVQLSFLTLSSAASAEKRVAVSVKFVLDASGERSQGLYTADAQVRQMIGDANRILENNGANWSLWLTEIREVPGAAEFFTIPGESAARRMEDAAKADAMRYAWRTDQVNIYVVDAMGHGIGGLCSFPVESEARPTDVIYINNQGIGNDWAFSSPAARSLPAWTQPTRTTTVPSGSVTASSP